MKYLTSLLIFISVFLSTLIIFYDISDQIYFQESDYFLEEPLIGFLTEDSNEVVIDSLKDNFDSFILINIPDYSPTVYYYVHNIEYLPEEYNDLFINYSPLDLQASNITSLVYTPSITNISEFPRSIIDSYTELGVSSEALTPISSLQLFLLRIITFISFFLSALLFIRAYKNEIIVYNLLNKSKFFIFKKILLKFILILITSLILSILYFYDDLKKFVIIQTYVDFDYSNIIINSILLVMVIVFIFGVLMKSVVVSKSSLWRQL